VEGLQVRVATADDAPVVYALVRAAFASTERYPHASSALRETQAQIGDALARGGALGELEGRAVAAVRFHLEEGAFHYARLAVRPASWGRGIGSAMVLWLESHAHALGCDRVRVAARSRWPDSRPFYLRRGYQIVGYSDRYGVPDLRTELVKRLEPRGLGPQSG